MFTRSLPPSLFLSLSCFPSISPPPHKFSRRGFFFKHGPSTLLLHLLAAQMSGHQSFGSAGTHALMHHTLLTYVSGENVHVPASGLGHVSRTCETSPAPQYREEYMWIISIDTHQKSFLSYISFFCCLHFNCKTICISPIINVSWKFQ